MLKNDDGPNGRTGALASDAVEAPPTRRPMLVPPPAPRRISAGLVLGTVCLVMVVLGIAWLVNKRLVAAKQTTSAMAGKGPPAVPVTPGVVMEKDVPIYLDGLGTVQAFNTVTVHARVDGQLQKVAFVEGQDVHAGDLLVQIDPEPFRTQMDQAIAKKGQDEAQLANARVDLKRYADLLAKEGVTQQVYDTQKALVDQLVAAVKADQAVIDSAKVQLDYTRIVSPIDGRIGIRLVDQGNLVHANDANGLVVITQLRPISVIFTLPEQMLGAIQKQNSPNAPLTVLAVDRDDNTVLGEGKVAVIDNQIDTTTGTIKIKANFPNDDLRLWPGQFVNARLLLTVRKASPVVPASVVQRGPEGPFAFVINDDETVDIRSVDVGPIEDGFALIEKGLRPGERVVVEGQYRLQKGSRVNTTETARTRTERRGSAAKPSGSGHERGSQAPGSAGKGSSSEKRQP
jgi:multidrug efflux system membrane fusion protein